MDVSLKYKVKSDYLNKTEADILWEFRGQKGEDAGKKNQEILEHVLEK